jgi:protein involved in polysaccharide export with SLBB domain
MNRPLTAMEAIMEAGGFTAQALPNRVGLLRKDQDIVKSYSVNLKDALKGNDTRPVFLQPDDIITVPRKTINL